MYSQAISSKPASQGMLLTLVPMSHFLVDEAHQALVTCLQSYMDTADIAQITDACHFADKAHIKDKRKSGEPYVTHPIAVANILAEYEADADTIIAAILHDTIEDTPVTKANITKEFNSTVADLVDGVTKLKTSKNKALNKAATFRKILTATLNDARVIIIKLADRLHNMSTMTAVRQEKRVATSEETLDFYLPFARIMGLNELADRLELLCFENLDAEQYHLFDEQLRQRKLIRQHRQNQISDYFYQKLHKLGIRGKVHLTDNRVDLFRAFFNHKRAADVLLNQYKFTLELENVSHCDVFFQYLKNRYSIKKEAIKDHIRKPYPGGYQALHIDYQANNEYLQLTIQTSTMYQAARYGVMLGQKAPLANQHILQASLKNLYELVDNDCAHNTVEALLDYFAKDKILVFTPDGDMQELPIGATALDFAYALSPFLGNHAITTSIDGKPATLATKLQTGQKVAIQTDPLSVPNAEWLGFITTAKARRGLQTWLKELSTAEQTVFGKEALARTIKDRKHNINDLTDSEWQALFDWQNTTDKNTIYQRIATGDLLPQLVVTKLFSDKANANPINSIFKAKKDTTVVAGTKGIELHYGNCCNPILGDNIVGVLTHSGLVVHRHRCFTMLDKQQQNPEQVLPLSWHEPSEQESMLKNMPEPMFNVMLCIGKTCDDDMISQIIFKLHELNVGVNDVYSTDQETLAYLMVTSRNHVAQIMRELRILLGFPSMKRLYHY